MSKKLRNELRKATMRNFSNNTIERYIIIDNDRLTETEKDEFVKKINEELWYAIQETNAVFSDRILPYVIVRRVIKDTDDATKLRIIINDPYNERPFGAYTSSVEISNLSHLINFKTFSPGRRVVVCDELIPGDAKIIIDDDDQISAAVDIFLDVATFNSVNYLVALPLSEKQKFSSLKLEFYKRHKLESFYLIDPINSPSYHSLAFSARTNKRTIDYNKYKYLWDLFIIDYKFNKIIKNPPAEIQILQHKDLLNLPSEMKENSYWEKYSGAKLLLRINQGPNDLEREKVLCNYFGITEFNVGETKIVPLSEYYNPYIRQQINELIVSAFKIIV